MSLSTWFACIVPTHRAQGTAGSRRVRVRPSKTTRVESLESRLVLTAPDFTSLTTFTVPENDTGAALIEATDADNDPLTFSLAGTGADDALFTIDPVTGDLTLLAPPDFENPLDANGDNVFEVDVEVSDSIEPPVLQSITISVHDIDDETPVIQSPATFNVDAGQTFVSNVFATDADAASVLQYTLTGNGPDDLLFAIDPASGVLEFTIVTDAANPVDADQNNIYEIEVKVSDGFQEAVQQIQVTVIPAAVNPVVALNDGAISFKKGQAPVAVAPNFTVTGNNLGTGALIVSINNVNTGKKRADFFDIGSLAGLGTVDTALTNGRYVTMVTLNPGVTADDIQNAVRGITFFTAKKGLKFTSRNVKIQVVDGNFNASNEVTKTINVKKK